MKLNGWIINEGAKMDQENKTEKLIEFWESRREYYKLRDCRVEEERCEKHVCAWKTGGR